MPEHPTSRIVDNRGLSRRPKVKLAVANRAPLAFHQRLDAYEPTRLLDAPELARALGVGKVFLKDESNRLGLPAFKILGASWAVYRALEARFGAPLEPWRNIAELAENVTALQPLTLVAATDGNHGRAVARMAALLQFNCRIYVPSGTAKSRIDGIAGEGASVQVVEGTYDDAVALSAEDASERCLVISDTSWPGYEDVPRCVIDGYSTILWEVDHELGRRSEEGPQLIAVQVGVGALAAAVVNYYRQPTRHLQPTIVSVEPLHAACLQASIEAGEITSIPGPHDSIMAGLNCGRPSMVAWPTVSSGVDFFISIGDNRAREAMRLLAQIGIIAGETGAAGLAGLLALLTGPGNSQYRSQMDIDDHTRVLLLITEGATDPQAYAEIVK